MNRRVFLALLFAAPAAPALACTTPALQLVQAARRQIGETTLYDPSYVVLTYPMGDVPKDRGVCTDVVIRAYREAFSIDLQKLLHMDMKANFSAYPKIWGLKKPDRNIDHRRVPNLQTYLRRHKAARAVPTDLSMFEPGDLITMTVAGKLPHIGIVSERWNKDHTRRLFIHNIGSGTQEEDALGQFPITGRFRFFPEAKGASSAASPCKPSDRENT